MSKEFIQAVKQQLAHAARVYNLPELETTDIRLDIRGNRLAGQARMRNGSLILRFHPDAVAKNYDEMVNETTPHEIAHLVCFCRPELGRHHDRGWQRVCKSLGGDAARTHSMNFGTPVSRTTYRYRSSCGEVIELSTQRHNRLQAGKVEGYTNRRTGAVVHAKDLIEVVGNPTPSKPVKAASELPIGREGGSKAARVRSYIRGFLTAGYTKEELLRDKATHIQFLYQDLEFGTIGAARSSFVDNVNRF